MTIGSKKGGKGWLWGRRPTDLPELWHAFNFKHSSNSINNFCKYMYMYVCRKRKIENKFKEKQNKKIKQ